MRKKLKMAAAFLGILSLVGLLGCQSSQATAKQVEEKLEDKYGEKFEVIALGNRWGTKDNDTVTTHVKALKNGIVFEANMKKNGKNLTDNYIYQKINSDISQTLKESLQQEGVLSQPKLFISGGKKLKYNTSDINLQEYIGTHSPDYFVGMVILKDDRSLTPEKIIQSYKSAYSNLQQKNLQTDIWIISSNDYEKAVKDFNSQPDVSKQFFDKFDVISQFYLDIKDGGKIESDNEELAKGNPKQ